MNPAVWVFCRKGKQHISTGYITTIGRRQEHGHLCGHGLWRGPFVLYARQRPYRSSKAWKLDVVQGVWFWQTSGNNKKHIRVLHISYSH